MNELSVAPVSQMGDLEVVLRMMLQGILFSVAVWLVILLCLWLLEWWALQRRKAPLAATSRKGLEAARSETAPVMGAPVFSLSKAGRIVRRQSDADVVVPRGSSR